MNKELLNSDNDPMGAAISDYFRYGKVGKLRVFSSLFDEDEIPVKQLFRTPEEFSLLESIAIEQATGMILDVGGGSGCHSLALQKAGKEVCAIDISPFSVKVMRERGVKNVKQVNLFDPLFCDKFDTILMLMNGSGIIGRLGNLPTFFHRMKELLNPEGIILMDSSDLRYLYEEEDGSFMINLNDDYYGEVDFRMKYKNIEGNTFDWLYIDFAMLDLYAAESGFRAEIIKKGEHYDYLAKLSRI